MSLADDNKDEEAEIKTLPLIDSIADLIEIDDIEADENDTLDQDSILFLLIYYLCIKVYKRLFVFYIKI